MACLVVRHKVFIPMYKPGLTCTKFVQSSHLAAFLKLISHKTLKIASIDLLVGRLEAITNRIDLPTEK